MTKAEKVRTNRVCAKTSVEMYYELLNAVDDRIIQVFDKILDILDQNTREYIFTDFLLFEEKTLDVKEYSIHTDGLYHFKECILHFEKKVNVEQWMIELMNYIEKQDGYYARRMPYQRYYNESLTHYLQIGIR